LPAEGGIVLSMMRMNRVLEVDYDNQLAVVEPGLVNLHLSSRVGPKGSYYAPEPSSQQTCTIGGNIDNKTGGPSCWRCARRSCTPADTTDQARSRDRRAHV